MPVPYIGLPLKVSIDCYKNLIYFLIQHMQDRKLNRMPSFNYSSRGGYFLTICCHNQKCFFGEIVNNEMVLNENGVIADNCLCNLTEHFGKCIIDEYIIMPNHIHVIIFIEDAVGNRHACSLQEESENESRSTQKLPTIIGSFKSAVSKLIHENGNKDFKWQKSYYDRVIRNNDELTKIRKYILDNPKNWEKDKLEKNENEFWQN